MYCPACGERNANGARVCTACGVELPVDVVSGPSPAPAQVPQILKAPLSRPAPLRPPSLDPLPPSGRSTAHTGAAPVVVAAVPVVPAPVVPAPVVPAPVVPAPVVPTPVVPAPVVPALVVPAPVVHAPVAPAPVVPAPRVAPTPSASVFDPLAATVIEEFQENTDAFDENDVTDPGQPHFDDDDDGVDVSLTSRTGEGYAIDSSHSDEEPARRSLPRVSSRAPGVGRYACAAIVDGVLAAGPALALALTVGGDGSAPFIERVIQTLLLTPSSLIVFVVTAIGLSTVHHALLVPRVGGTVGGLLTGVSLRTSDGEGATLPRAIVRGVVTSVSALAFLAGPLYALWVDDHRRALADRLAGTRLVTRGLV